MWSPREGDAILSFFAVPRGSVAIANFLELLPLIRNQTFNIPIVGSRRRLRVYVKCWSHHELGTSIPKV